MDKEVGLTNAGRVGLTKAGKADIREAPHKGVQAGRRMVDLHRITEAADRPIRPGVEGSSTRMPHADA